MRPTLIAGNWKMNGSRSMVEELVDNLKERGPFECQVLLIPPFVFLERIAELLSGTDFHLGAQDVDHREESAVTGAVSASMLRDVGCEYALVGHSERRTLFGESSEIVAEKLAACLAGGIRPILCVGETLDERERGETMSVVESQIGPVIDRVGPDGLGEAVIAYEPVWAIGTGKSATPAQADEVHRQIRQFVGKARRRVADGIQLLYGGSVNGRNAAELLRQPDIDGALVGGASLKADEFASICKAAASKREAAG